MHSHTHTRFRARLRSTSIFRPAQRPRLHSHETAGHDDALRFFSLEKVNRSSNSKCYGMHCRCLNPPADVIEEAIDAAGSIYLRLVCCVTN